VSSRFVVQEHTTPAGVHWDLMLEQGEALTTFRLEQPPQAAREGIVRAVNICDHPLRFLTYEGPVQKGTGQVRIVDRGSCDVVDEAGGVITLQFRGTILQGGFALRQVEGVSWQLAPRP
jgi:hypothetical protein